jgi:hypothetical protein
MSAFIGQGSNKSYKGVFASLRLDGPKFKKVFILKKKYTTGFHKLVKILK